ncbi:MAG TPA: hypothetical protein VGQ83_42775 [Polyangia bacterium]|jgi:hypothetical protein
MRPRWIVTAAGLALAGAAAARIALGGRAEVPLTKLVAEVALGVSLLAVGAAAYQLLAGRGRVGWGAAAVAVVAWGMGCIAPLARVAFPPAALFEGRMGGERRDATTDPAPRRGRFVVGVARPRAAGGELVEGGAYVLHVGIGTVTQQLGGVLRKESDQIDLRLEAGERVHLFFERIHGPVEVAVRPPALPRALVRWACLLAALLAILVDVLGFRDRARLRGLLAGAVGATAVFVALLDPRAELVGRAACGLAGLAVAGGVGGVVLAAVVGGAIFRRRRAAR